MGAPSSGLIAEIFLQHMEHSHLVHLTQKHNIINYCRYVDDILIIFDPNHTTLEMILNDFNSLHPKLQFTAETEHDHILNYLDISIHRTPTNMKTAIYRSPHSQTPLFPLPPTIPRTTNTPRSSTYTTDSTPTICNTKNTSRSYS
jgi:hypothetical protein